jgi:hypothetical protein
MAHAALPHGIEPDLKPPCTNKQGMGNKQKGKLLYRMT